MLPNHLQGKPNWLRYLQGSQQREHHQGRESTRSQSVAPSGAFCRVCVSIGLLFYLQKHLTKQFIKMDIWWVGRSSPLARACYWQGVDGRAQLGLKIGFLLRPLVLFLLCSVIINIHSNNMINDIYFHSLTTSAHSCSARPYMISSSQFLILPVISAGSPSGPTGMLISCPRWWIFETGEMKY